MNKTSKLKILILLKLKNTSIIAKKLGTEASVPCLIRFELKIDPVTNIIT